MKEYLCKLRLEITSKSKFNKWTMEDLNKAISKLKTNKCKDPHGHINELYKNMGLAGLSSLLDMLNLIKSEILIPDELSLSNISTIYKGKGSKQNVVNLRGIFKLPIVRNLLDRLIILEEQTTISTNMGDFQVGNQKGRNIRDHTLIVHAVINEAKTKKIPIDLIFTDIKQCFDAVWLDEATNDLYNSGLTSRNLNLLYEGNKKTLMSVETSFGKSERTELQKVVMQGSVPGGLICSNQISKLCNKLYKEGDVYMYLNKLPIPPLAMVDDVANVNTCNSIEALSSNIKTDTFILRKKLEGHVGEGKCQWVHAGNGNCCSAYKISGNEMTQADSYKYLGDQVSDEWDILYDTRCDKAKGYSATSLAMCTEISLGYHVFHIAKLLHQSIFLNGTLLKMETWPNCSIKRVEKYERIEQAYFRRILNAHSKSPIESIYLEIGVLPFRFHLMKRRIMYLSTLMKRDDNDFTKKFVMVQMTDGLEGDFYPQTKRDMISLNISDEDLLLSKQKLKEFLQTKVNSAAFTYLMEKARSHSKVKDELYVNCKGCDFYGDRRFSPELSSLIFKFRTRTFMVKNNFRNNYTNTDIMCPLCGNEEDTQEHLLRCEKININDDEGEYIDVYSNDASILLNIAMKLKAIVEKRNRLLNPEDVNSCF